LFTLALRDVLPISAIVPLWKGQDYRLLGDPKVLVPPRDGSSLHPDEIKEAFLELASDFRIETVVMDMHRAEDIAAWVEDELGVRVIDHAQGQTRTHVQDFEAFMEGLRNGTVKHTGDRDLRAHVLNAVARRLPGGDHRFDRPSAVRGNANAQDRRVIDALTAAAMVVEFSTRAVPATSVYEQRFATA
jgi:phage terminase large subunit-like protein